MNILITICARGGSKGVLGKNIKKINNKHLIGYTIESAKKFCLVMTEANIDIALSTDSDQIKNICKELGLKTSYCRPDILATDTSGKIDAIIDVLNFYEDKNRMAYDFIIDLDVTSPLRTSKDLKESLAIIQKNTEALNIFSVSKANRSPYFNMVEHDKNGFVKLVKNHTKNLVTRQSSPEVYDMNASFYIYKRSFFKGAYKTAITTKSMAYLVDHLCFDVDEEIDFIFLEYLITNNKLDFEL